jgi:hypothetical protein
MRRCAHSGYRAVVVGVALIALWTLEPTTGEQPKSSHDSDPRVTVVVASRG